MNRLKTEQGITRHGEGGLVLKRDKWSIESTIGLAFIVVSIIIGGMALAVIGFTAAAVNPTPEQTIIQQVETTGDVKRLCIEAKTGEHIDAMGCQLIDPQSGGVMR
jgi:hypothetical protein